MSRLWIVALLIAACTGDPYSRYASQVHDDVDGGMLAAMRMTARMDLTVVHNRIPNDSLAVVAGIVAGAARTIRERATHFAQVTPPADLAQPHANLEAQLRTLADAIDAMAATFRRCADAARAGDTAGTACEAELSSVSERYGYAGPDLSAARSQIQRLLLPHGVLLPRMTS